MVERVMLQLFYLMYALRDKRSLTKRRTNKRGWIILIIVLVVLVIGVAAWWFWNNRSQEPDAQPTQNQTQTQPQPEPEPEEAKPALVDLQPTLDQWISAHSGDYGIVVYDPANQKVIAEHQPQKQYFTASIYKLYVVYLALQDLQAGLHQPDEAFQGGRTRMECLKEAIYSSDSPCAEKLALEIGYANINQRLAEYGLTDTSFPGFVTSAADVSLVLKRLQSQADLNNDYDKFLMDALTTQIYRDKGLPKLTPEGAYAVKTGFQGNEIWHDTGLLTLPNDREYIVAYFSDNAGSSRTAADFGKTIYDALAAAEQ